MTNWTRRLVAMGACPDAVAWAKEQPDLTTAWATCQRGDWMLWLAGRCIGKAGSAEHRRVILAACGCARLSLARWTERYPDDARPLLAIEAAERWAATGRGKRAAYAAHAAAAAAATAAYSAPAGYAYAAAAYAHAATAAAYAAYDAYADADSATYAAASASAAADSAGYAAAAYSASAGYADARSSELSACADIVRGIIPKPPKMEQR